MLLIALICTCTGMEVHQSVAGMPPGKNPLLCSPAGEPNDCAFDGAFTCISAAWAANATYVESGT